jgi:hypothetical protein
MTIEERLEIYNQLHVARTELSRRHLSKKINDPIDEILLDEDNEELID